MSDYVFRSPLPEKKKFRKTQLFKRHDYENGFHENTFIKIIT